MTNTLDEAALAVVVKQVLLAESRLRMDPADLRDDEPLNGGLLRVTSMGFLGMLIKLEDVLGIELPDDIFVGRTFTTVDDVVQAVRGRVA
ncbi:acyl carrier protein [Lentzea aerocolonigenes]|uniref:acyl carrier protein n=1 Tax=Lentzea aerocolonigenes TaxID=68170 RepID=UPI0004C30502|nr:phosphopantetheine-binding protein [Lentzea aerocolonigenes]MCP2243426.1 acyl carrier protein [Lentzea aerocolonigenes]